MRRIIVLGGGYGGFKVVTRLLEKKLPLDVVIELVDFTPYHNMKTEFFALAAGTASDREVRMDFPKHKQFIFTCDKVNEIKLDEKKIVLEQKGEVKYDYLVVALGCEDKYYDTKGAKEFAYSVQTIEQTRKTFEAVQNTKPYGQITIVGAGLTGVEVASELRQSRSDLKIRLLDKGATILPVMPEKIQKYVEKWLSRHDIEIMHSSHVEYIEDGSVCNNGTCLPTDITIWAGGIQPNQVVRSLDVEKNHHGQVLLNDYHQIPDHADVYVVGDCAGIPYPPSAQVAQQQGKQIVEVLFSILTGNDPKKPGEIKLKGTLGSLGKFAGFATAFGLPLSGVMARLMKTGVLWIHKYNK